MTKIPVFRTVAAAYTFAFQNLGAIAGLIWIPMLIMTVVGFFAETTYLDALASVQQSKNAADLYPGMLWVIVYVVISFLGYAMMIVAVLQLALNQKKGHPLAHFALGPPEWRVFGSLLVLFGCAIAFLLVFTVVMDLALIGSGAGAHPSQPVATAIIAVICACVLAAFVVAARLSFFIPAVSVLEEKSDLIRTWNLAAGNTFRIVALLLSLLVPLFLLQFALVSVVFAFSGTLPADSGQAQLLPNAEEIALIHKQMPVVHAVSFLLAPIWVGINAGLVAAAYRALKPVPGGSA